MHKIHVSKTYNQDVATLFSAISDHATFLSGGGLLCKMIVHGQKYPNGDGAIRRVTTSKIIFEEKIYGYELNKEFAYQIVKTIPKQPFVHEKGWLVFAELGDQTRVDWYSNFTITTPIVGRVIGWFVKRQMSKVFLKRLNYLKCKL